MKDQRCPRNSHGRALSSTRAWLARCRGAGSRLAAGFGATCVVGGCILTMPSASAAAIQLNAPEAFELYLTGSAPAPILPASGGTPEIAAESSRPEFHSTPSTPNAEASPDTASCGWGIRLLYEEKNAYSEGYSICNEPVAQAWEVCAQQKYEGSWHNSKTCVRVPSSGTVTNRGFSLLSRGITCTKGRYYRAWGWYYTPTLEPKTSTDLIPSEGGETLC